jgi:hypothetical protein
MSSATRKKPPRKHLSCLRSRQSLNLLLCFLPYQKLGVGIQDKRRIRKEPRRDPGHEVTQRAEEEASKQASAGTTLKTHFLLERCASGANNTIELTIGRRATTLAPANGPDA